MKTIFTLLLSSLFSLASFAYDGARLTISSVTSNKIFVEVDGRRYNLNGNTVTVRDIHPGYHNVKVYRESKRNNNGWGFGNRNKREESLYNTRVYLKDGYHFDILVNRFGKVLVDERRIDRNDDWYTDDEDDDYYDNDRNRDRGNNRNDRHNDRDRDWDNHRNDRNNDDRYDRNDRNSQYDEMSDANFNQAKESLRKEWFENTRLSTAKQIIDRNYFTSRQVKDLMLLFTFENNRLDIAKYAYSKVVDKGNYYIVNDALSMTSNKEELNRFIREQR